MAALRHAESVPPLGGLLANGVPSISALDTYIADLDMQQEENSKQLDGCLNEILHFTNDLIGRQCSTPKEALQEMMSCHVLEKSSCYDPQPEQINGILQHANQMLVQSPGCEETLLQELLSLSSEQGLTLPLRVSETDPTASSFSLNAVSDAGEHHINQQWDQIAMKLRRYFVNQLQKLPFVTRKLQIDIQMDRRVHYFQSLCCLQPTEEAWDRYQSVRVKQLETYFKTLIPDIDSDNFNILTVTENCQQIADIVIAMIDEDFILAHSGIIHSKPSSIFQVLHNIYLERFADDMAALIEEIWDEVQEDAKQNEGTVLKSHSDIVSSGDTKPQTKRGHGSNSLTGSDKRDASSGKGNIHSIKYFKSMVNIVVAVLRIEQHWESLQKAVEIDTTGLSVKKSKRKGSLKGVLKPSFSPEPGRSAMSMMSSSIDSTTDTWNLPDKMTASFSSSASSLMSDNLSAPKVVEKARLDVRVKWNWKIVFKKIAPDLAVHIDQLIRAAMSAALDREQADWKTNQKLETVPVKYELWGGKLGYPKVVSKGVYDFMSVLDTFLPFAKAGSEGPLIYVRTAFGDAVNTCLRKFYAHLSKLSSEVPLHAPMKNLYIILSSCAYIRNSLLHYEMVLTLDDSNKLLGPLYKQFVELVDQLSHLVVEVHNNYIATCILHDADSNNWAEMKEFYEDERCSFCIQMWNYHMRGLQHDLWSICPPQQAQNMFSTIFNESLLILAQRYTQAKPSFRRVTQFRNDIITILLGASELLYPASSSISEYIDVSHSQQPHHSIHNLCSTLLAAMAVVASPIDALYKVHKKGYQYKRSKELENSQEMLAITTTHVSNTQWLSWIQRTVMQPGYKHYDDMRTTVAIYHLVRLLLSQPVPDWAMVLQAYLMKDYTLSILFLTQSLDPDGVPKGKNETVTSSPTYGPEIREFVHTLIYVLSRCGHFTDALSKAILPVIDRCKDWSCFDAKHSHGKEELIPLWMESVFSVMRPFIVRVLAPVVKFVLSYQPDGKPIKPFSAVIEELPCGCHVQEDPTPKSNKTDVTKAFMETALRLFLTQLTEDIFILPTCVCILLRSLQTQCVERGIKTHYQCAGIKLLALAFKQCLTNPDVLGDLTGISLTQANQEHFSQLAECVYHILVSGKVKGSSTPRLAGKFCKENKDWMIEKLNIILSYLTSEIFEVSDNSKLERATTLFTDQMFTGLMSEVIETETGSAPLHFCDELYRFVTSEVVDTATGVEELRKLYWMIANNRLWLEKHLDIHHVLPMPEATHTPPFTIDMTPRPQSAFDPHREFQMIGPCKLDHETIQNLKWDWMKLLKSDLGLSEFGFRSLLYNRHEMLDSTYLEDSEKKHVRILKAVFENEPHELS
ncbi:hypothetical protein CHS0354_013026 [Potamilus streckersoni]|uniref:KIAA0825 n=1 Tax=Potamilus streckersoni TaxID=2493646 RepID=A0AAE0W4T6_9BIVA|nr:hypothetical protein CHS0354_013026 [Potamilus streckersoni]